MGISLFLVSCYAPELRKLNYLKVLKREKAIYQEYTFHGREVRYDTLTVAFDGDKFLEETYFFSTVKLLHYEPDFANSNKTVFKKKYLQTAYDFSVDTLIYL